MCSFGIYVAKRVRGIAQRLNACCRSNTRWSGPGRGRITTVVHESTVSKMLNNPVYVWESGHGVNERIEKKVAGRWTYTKTTPEEQGDPGRCTCAYFT